MAKTNLVGNMADFFSNTADKIGEKVKVEKKKEEKVEEPAPVVKEVVEEVTTPAVVEEKPVKREYNTKAKKLKELGRSKGEGLRGRKCSDKMDAPRSERTAVCKANVTEEFYVEVKTIALKQGLSIEELTYFALKNYLKTNK